MGKNSKKKCINCIAITGPSASGKSGLAEKLKKNLGKDNCIVLCQDNYYKDWSHLKLKQRKKINFDALKSFDIALLRKHLKYLKQGRGIRMPLYDFVKSKRLKASKEVMPLRFVIIEGLMPFFDAQLRSICDYKIYIDTPSWLCLARRITRDIKERGESISSVCKRYFKDVLVMQEKYVEPQAKWADAIIDGSKKFNKKLVTGFIRSFKK